MEAQVFERSIINRMNEWRNKPNRKPLILRGARQVGKTTAVKMFARQFKYSIFLNMEEPSHRMLFKESLSFEERISAVLLHGSIPKDTDDVLIFIDEIQSEPLAIATLRYFYETAPHIFVIAAGSLLEAAIDLKASFPVGRVEYLMMHPCSFNEFCIATGKTELASILQKVPSPDYAHDKAMNVFKKYMLIGGMPEAVAVYAKTQDMVSVNSVYENLLTSFIDDVEKYAKNGFIRVVRHIIKSAFAEVGNRIKFQGFGKSTYSSKDISESFDLLEKAMLMKLVYPTSSVKIPIEPDLKKSPRLMLLDSGILHYQSGLQSELFISEDPEAVAFGKLVEHIIGVMIYSGFSSPSANLNFWAREKKQSNAEVDFVYQFKGKVIPIEVKSGAAGRLRSLHQFMDQSPHHYAVRFCNAPVSIENAVTIKGTEYKLLNLPWYLAEKLENYLEWFVKK